MADAPIHALKQTRDQLRSILSAASSRGSKGFGQSFFNRNSGKPERDLLKELGYKEKLTFDDYWAKYDRQDIAGRIIDAPAKATWRKAPLLVDDGGDPDDPEAKTEFEEAWEDLARADGMNVGHYLERADRLAGIGRFGILLLGLNDKASGLEEEVNVGALSSPDALLFLSAFSEGSVKVKSLDADPMSKRFGKVEMYEVDLAGDVSETNKSKKTWTEVHHSRVIHIAEDLLEDEIYGRPRLKRVFDRLDDLLKIVGGSAEMFWQGAFPPILFHTQKDFEIGEETDVEAIEDEIKDLIHQLKRWTFLEGVEAQTINTDAKDPSKHVEVQMLLIATALGWPQRILAGSERGELASSQDERAWNTLIADRQTDFAESQILRPLVNRLVEYGILPSPAGEHYDVEWPAQSEPTSKERSEIANLAASVGERLGRSLGISDAEVHFVVSEVLALAGIDLSEVEPIEDDEPEEPEEEEEGAAQFQAFRRRAS